jgi:hypothetical protein
MTSAVSIRNGCSEVEEFSDERTAPRSVPISPNGPWLKNETTRGTFEP